MRAGCPGDALGSSGAERTAAGPAPTPRSGPSSATRPAPAGSPRIDTPRCAVPRRIVERSGRADDQHGFADRVHLRVFPGPMMSSDGEGVEFQTPRWPAGCAGFPRPPTSVVSRPADRRRQLGGGDIGAEHPATSPDSDLAPRTADPFGRSTVPCVLDAHLSSWSEPDQCGERHPTHVLGHGAACLAAPIAPRSAAAPLEAGAVGTMARADMPRRSTNARR